MKTKICLLASTLLIGGFSSSAFPQNTIKWQEVLKMGKKDGFPAGASFDYQGIAIGDSLAEVKSKLEAIAQDQKNNAIIKTFDTPFFMEHEKLIRGDAASISPMYTYKLVYNNQGKTIASFYFTAPSSGSQLYSMEIYNNGNFSRAELVEAVSTKLGYKPTLGPLHYNLWTFKNGKQISYDKPCEATNLTGKSGPSNMIFDNLKQADFPEVGQCVVLFAIGSDIVSSYSLTFSDFERIKKNFLADNEFVYSVAKSLYKTPALQKPKL